MSKTPPTARSSSSSSSPDPSPPDPSLDPSLDPSPPANGACSTSGTSSDPRELASQELAELDPSSTSSTSSAEPDPAAAAEEWRAFARGAVEAILGVLASSDPVWEPKPHELTMLTDSAAPVCAKHFGDLGAFTVELSFGLAILAYVTPRLVARRASPVPIEPPPEPDSV